jgi:1-deoxyxylulose-5-phosphate synthase
MSQILRPSASTMPVAPLTLARVMAQATTPVPIISGHDAGQIAPSLAALSLPLSPRLYAAITALSASPAPATDRLEEV